MTEQNTVKVNYSGNSHRERDNKAAAEAPKERPKVEKVEGISVSVKKKTVGRKVADMFNGDDMGNVGSYVLFEVLVPAAKNMLFDAVKQGLERKLYGSNAPRSSVGRPNISNTPWTPYNRMSSNGASASRASEPANDISRKARAMHDFTEIVFDERGDAELILDRLRDIILEYGNAKVADLYEMVEVSAPFTDHKFGWTDLRDARVRPVRSGYILDLPRTIQLHRE